MVLKYYLGFFVVLGLLSFTLAEVFQQGKASYYHHKMDGRKTSSGEVYRNDSLTAAHKTLPFGTKLLVRNLRNDSTVIVKVNDRLSKSSPYVIDVSVKAAKKLNFIHHGVTTVTLEKIN